MCGIVGYIGKKNAQDFLISGLKRMEYRGYDSAGIVTLQKEGKETLLRASGKIANLEEKLARNRRNDTVGIGHTRWATHGEPSERNAHPHQAGPIFLVHNGIIENYKELKGHLKDHDFKSETDSEVLAALICSFYRDGKTLFDAVVQALKLVKGTYGIAVVSTDNPNEIIVARSGSPLIVGVQNDETFAASDASALVGFTKQAIYLNDGEVARLTAGSIEIKTLNAEPVSAKVEEIETNLAAIQKGGYDHFLLKEIMEQPESLKETLRGRIQNGVVHLGGPGLSEKELREIKHLVIVGCGTAYHAGLTAAYYIEQFTPEITVETVVASEYRYRNAYIPPHSVALIVSQSGETADTLACLREIKKQGVKTVGIVNAIGSTIAREVDGGTYVHVGPEISVASTKAFTSQTIAMIMFGLTIAQAKGVRSSILKSYADEIFALPLAIQGLLASPVVSKIQEIARHYAKYDHAIYLGRDTAYPVAMEGALKLKEVSYIDANSYAFGELKHGPLALVDDRFFEVALLPTGELYDKAISNLQEVLARGGHVIAITNNEKFDLLVEEKILLPSPGSNVREKNGAKVKVAGQREGVNQTGSEIAIFSPILMNVVLQLLAYYIAAARGLDVDQPRNLAKSVTVE